MNRTFILQKDLPDEIILQQYLDSEYYISMKGDVYSMHQNKLLKGYPNNGYLWFSLHIDEEIKDISQHRLIAEVFIPNPNNLPLVRHLDDNKSNIAISNLAWGTKSDNMNDAVSNGLLKNRPSPQGIKHFKAKLTDEIVKSIRSDFKEGIHYLEVSAKYGISQGNAYKIKNGNLWKHVV